MWCRSGLGLFGQAQRLTLAALERRMPTGVTWSRPQGGMFVWVWLPEGMDGKVMLERALAEERVAFVPGKAFFATDAATLPSVQGMQKCAIEPGSTAHFANNPASVAGTILA